MNIDVHCHVVGNCKDIARVHEDVYVYAEDNQLLLTRILVNMVEDDLVRMEADLDHDGMISTHEYTEHVYRMLAGSKYVDGIVLLAMDAVFSPKNGDLDVERTDLWATNEYLVGVVRDLNRRLTFDGDPLVRAKKFFLGASVSPNRRDWREKLDFAAAQPETVLLKLIPSTQHVHLRDAKHREYYDAVAATGLPLLCHVGPEYSFPEGIRKKELDNFRYLESPLSRGVTVIAAHGASPVFPVVDRNEIREFVSFMKSANSGGSVRLWADTSALSLSTRIPFIQEMVESYPPEWLVHGSDFPIPVDGWTHLPLVTHDVSPKEYISICREKNTLDRDVLIKRAHGFADSILGNAENALRMG